MAQLEAARQAKVALTAHKRHISNAKVLNNALYQAAREGAQDEALDQGLGGKVLAAVVLESTAVCFAKSQVRLAGVRATQQTHTHAHTRAHTHTHTHTCALPRGRRCRRGRHGADPQTGRLA